MVNQIPTLQNAPAQLKFLRAQRREYVIAKRLLVLQFVLTVALPMASVATVFIWHDLKGTAAVISLLVLLFDATLIDRYQKRVRKHAAKAQEEFDCATLQMPWDSFTVGEHPDPENIHEAAELYVAEEKAPLENWYPAIVGKAPLHLARIICQRTNLIYDSKLRRRFGRVALSISIFISVGLAVTGVALKLTLEELLLNVAVPVAPIILWGLREHLRQHDAAESSEHMKRQAQSLWDRARAGSCTVEECTAESRLLQNAIFDRRTNAPTIFNWIYKVMRPSLEDQMEVGAEQMVAQVTSSNPDGNSANDA